MESKNLSDSLFKEASFFNDLINSKYKQGRIPLQADYRRATKYIPNNSSDDEPIDPELFNILEGDVHRIMLKKIIDNGGNVLDVCCGPGGISLELAREGLNVEGFDLSPDAIFVANKMKNENPFNENFGSLKYECLDVNLINFENKKYDSIIGISAFHHIYDLEIFLSKCHESLTNNGIMVTFDDIGFSKIDFFIKNSLMFVLPKRGLSYKKKFLRLIDYVFFRKRFSNEIFSPMEVWASKHDEASDLILDFWTIKLKTDYIYYYGAFSGFVCGTLAGPDWFRYPVAKLLVRLDKLLIKIGVCKGFYRVIISKV
jgi:2-polyprenyl-3-methyl-5-hydroxy-6-metoxy-1,4-benzoquinol methylase